MFKFCLVNVQSNLVDDPFIWPLTYLLSDGEEQLGKLMSQIDAAPQILGHDQASQAR